MTKKLFTEDAYLTELTTNITEINVEPQPHIILESTIFYALGGGQPGDVGEIVKPGTKKIDVIDTRYDREDKNRIFHFITPEDDISSYQVGDEVTISINWQQRHRLMRMHTAMHLLCALIPHPVTGGGCGETESRVEFDMETTDFDKAALSQQLNKFVAQALPVEHTLITEQELDDNPNLVRTMSVQPPRGAGTIRMIKVGDDLDYQPCGGTHVKNTSEIGELVVTKIKSKGKQNKRVSLALVNP